MATRKCDTRLSILTETPGLQHLEIHGNRLPTYNQVLLCYLSHMEKKRLEDTTKHVKLTQASAICVVKEVLKHYQRAHIMTIHETKMAEKVEALHKEYASLRKLNPVRRVGNPKVQLFQGKGDKTMPFWPKDVEKKMEETKRGKTTKERAAIEEDLSFLKSMKTDRKYTYTGKDLVTSKSEKRRQFKVQSEKKRLLQEENRPNSIPPGWCGNC